MIKVKLDGSEVEMTKDTKEEAPGPSGSSGAPVVVIIVLIVVFLLIAYSPDNCSGPAPIVTPLSLPGGGQPAPEVPSGPGTTIGCELGIAAGTIADVVHPQVRIRWSAGYMGKNDATDSKKYMTTGDRVKVISGPEMKDGLCWWLVEHKGVQGWTADHSREGRRLLAADP